MCGPRNSWRYAYKTSLHVPFRRDLDAFTYPDNAEPQQPPYSCHVQDGEDQCRNAELIQEEQLASFFNISEFRSPLGLGTSLAPEYNALQKYIDRLYDLNMATNKGKANAELCVGRRALLGVELASKTWQVLECDAIECVRKKDALRASAPVCGWDEFREWVLTVLSCWMPAMLRVFSDYFLFVIADGLPIRVVSDCCVDFHGVVDVLTWANYVAMGVPSFDLFSTEQLLLNLQGELRGGYDTRALETISGTCREKDICPCRMWNVAFQSNMDTAGVYYLASLAPHLQDPDKVGRHISCTSEMCIYTYENSTVVKQLHKCHSICTEETKFEARLLNEAFRPETITQTVSEWRQTAWSVGESVHGQHTLCSVGDKYMALSHVWSDGTGVGMKTNGQVNTCLFAYFANIAARLGCSGIWWDAISIPSGRRERRIAMNTMLENYKYAAVTVIHDSELVNLEWTEDGAPAAAVVLSAWFTRGWTAAELFASRDHPVKILFKNPGNPNEPLIKDLKNEVFKWLSPSDAFMGMKDRIWSLLDRYCCPSPIIGPAFDDKRPSRPPQVTVKKQDQQEWNGLLQSWTVHLEMVAAFQKKHMLDERTNLAPKLGYFIASEIIQRVYQGSATYFNNLYMGLPTPMASLQDVLQILRPRITSWAVDRLIIAALMCLPPGKFGFTETLTGPEITKRILTHLECCHPLDMFHASVPIVPNGRWSWCPPSIFDLCRYSRSMSVEVLPKAWIRDGTLCMNGLAALSVLESDRLVPLGHHSALAASISVALLERNHCFLLQYEVDGNETRQQFILAQAVRIDDQRSLTVYCRWFGCVYLEMTHITGDLHAACQHKESVSNRRLWHSTGMEFIFGDDVGKNRAPLASIGVDIIFSAKAYEWQFL
ncbi:hypothetical protein OIDMADRAFT_59909 [Oidiodendron maius Zn]|uniref:Heterokaryon incompatibility domain-containing protein n=1 Tax=Oidiodendron maius (strain Zn) TaxID=913774 RepID=A0A0C3C946_OIDMZ|nr:hypothetical protein OIDMADRAFT_59909 [Oidiodendron maius Zn]